MLTDCHQVVGVHALEVGGHFLDPVQDVCVAADGITARLIDKIP